MAFTACIYNANVKGVEVNQQRVCVVPELRDALCHPSVSRSINRLINQFIRLRESAGLCVCQDDDPRKHWPFCSKRGSYGEYLELLESLVTKLRK